MNQRIITNTKECAYRTEIGSLIYCKHYMPRAIEYCNVSKFPDECPLDEVPVVTQYSTYSDTMWDGGIKHFQD
jgi:hypothetical protein